MNQHRSNLLRGDTAVNNTMRKSSMIQKEKEINDVRYSLVSLYTASNDDDDEREM
jgi:hypothetical protein